MSKVTSAENAVRLIRDGDVVTVSSSSGLGCPDKVLAALGARFAAEGHPRDLTTLHPIAAGDMYGIRGIDHLARPGMLKKVLAGSYPSGPSSLPMPDIWRLIVDNQIAAYNVPSGVLFDMHRDAAAKRPGVLTKVGLGTFVDPELQGCAMNARAAAEPVVRKIEFAGEEWLFFPTIAPRVAIVRATTADERGNLSCEHEGAFLGVLDQALAARNNGGVGDRAGQTRGARGFAQAAARARARGAGGSRRGRSRPAADHADSIRPGDQRRDHAARRQLRAAGVGTREGHRTARRPRVVVRCRGQSGLRHLGQRAAHPARGRPARSGHLGDRARRGGRRAAAGFRFRLRRQRRRDRTFAQSVHVLPGRRVRRGVAVVSADRPRRQRQRVQARRQALSHGRLRRLRRHHHARATPGVLRLLHGRREACRSATASSPSLQEGKSRKLVDAVEHVTFSGRHGAASAVSGSPT